MVAAVDFNAEQQLKCTAVAQQFTGLVREFVQYLMNYYTYSEQRSKEFPVDSQREPLSAINKQVKASPPLVNYI